MLTAFWQLPKLGCFFPLLRRFTCALVLALASTSAAQAFQLVTLDEQRVNLLDYTSDDQWTVMMFWGTDCIPCEEQKPAFEAFHRQYQGSLASVVGVAIDGVENKSAILELIDLHDPSYPNFMAFSDVYHRQFEELVGKPFRATPRYLIFAPGGKLYADTFGKMNFEELARHLAAQNQ